MPLRVRQSNLSCLCGRYFALRTDDTLLYGPNMEDIDEAIQSLTDAGMNLEIEDDVAGFLGVHIERRNDGTINMTQVGLTDRIITALNIGNMHAKRTLTEFGCLGKDEWGIPHKEHTIMPRPLGCYNTVKATADLT